MKAIIVCCVVILISGSAIFFYNKNKNDRIVEKKQAEQLERLKDDMEETKRHSEWLQKNLDFENEMRSLLRRAGYTLEQANDSLIADQDRTYLESSLKDSDIAWWYKEHRKDLLNFPDEYYKQFPKRKH